MDNKFYVRKYRFHLEHSNIIGFLGFFRQKKRGNEHFMAILDRKRIKCQVQEWTYDENSLAINREEYLRSQYCVWVKLPNEWEQGDEIHLVQYNDKEKKEIYSVPVGKLAVIKDELPYHIDVAVKVKDGFVVAGWYLCARKAEIIFKDSGETIHCKIMAVSRNDVKKEFPEALKNGIHGFQTHIDGEVSEKIQLIIKAENKVVRCQIDTDKTFIERTFARISETTDRIHMYYIQNGSAATVKKMAEKIKRRGMSEDMTYSEWLKMQYPSKAVLKEQREMSFAYTPKISIVVPLYCTPKKYLKELIRSVIDQSYENWELCLSDGSGENSPIRNILRKYEESDERIRVVHNHEKLRISQNTNKALEISTGEYIAFADHDDLLMPNALYECVSVINEHQNAKLIYTDEDKISGNGKEYFEPHFKSDFNPDMLGSVNYICHLCVVKKSIVEKIGGLNPDFDGAQDYDFVLRAIEAIENKKDIIHIPRVLYHWRAHRNSTAENPESKNYAFKAGKRAIEASLSRRRIDGEVLETEYKGFYRVKRRLHETPLISVIIPTKDHVGDLKKCLKSLEEINTYENMEYIIVENNSEEEETFQYYEQLQKEMPKAKVVRWVKKGFNYPAINNFGVDCSGGKYILFLNNDTEIVNPDCVAELLSQCQRPEVGAVGARLYYEDGTVQHAGVVLGIGGVAGHAFVGFEHDDPGYMTRSVLIQDYSAVTAACMMMRRDVFEQVGRFDEGYAVAFNDVDLCMKIREAGYLIVYDPYAELNHYESKSRGYEDTEEKIQRFTGEIDRFQSKWRDALRKGDPYYNPNLTLKKNDFSFAFQDY